MTLPVIVIRPEPGSTATVERGRDFGLDIQVFPLFEIRSVAWTPPVPEAVDALLVGSANAFRHGGAALERFRSKPVYAVGEATAEAARQAGFEVAMTGEGGLQGLLDNAQPLSPRLLRIAGREQVALHPPEGVNIMLRVAYDNIALPMPDALAAKLRQGALVLLHSAAAARHLAAECDRCAVARDAVLLAALGPRISAAAGAGWAAIADAVEPNEGALLALAREMCHETRH